MKQRELETKVLNINEEAVVSRLQELGAQEFPKVLTRRWIFDLESENTEFIRLRSDGTKHTLTYKFKTQGSVKIGRTEEVEVEVSDFDKTLEILRKLTFKDTFYQEVKRRTFKLGKVEINIDSWPHIPPFLEIEASSHGELASTLESLHLTGKDEGDLDIKDIYEQNNLDIHSFSQLKF